MFSYCFILVKITMELVNTIQSGWEANQSQVPMHTHPHAYSHLWAILSSQSTYWHFWEMGTVTQAQNWTGDLGTSNAMPPSHLNIFSKLNIQHTKQQKYLKIIIIIIKEMCISTFLGQQEPREQLHCSLA